MSMVPPEIPFTIRNANFLTSGFLWVGVALIALAINVPSGFGLGRLSIALVAVPALAGAVCFALWRACDFETWKHGVRIGRLFGDLVLQWPAIRRFEIREPARRTPFMLNFSWWADQARVVLTDGTVHRIRGLQPWHGTTALAFFSVSRPTAADAIVDTLNRYRDEAAARSGEATS